ncbi:MAG: glycosyltransferase family 39 protein [Thermoanaerobaculia bacterium]
MNRPGARPAIGLLAALALAKGLLHAALSGRYGYFRDELYFLDCGRHLDWGYVDHAPVIGLFARAALALGGSLPALRVFPAVAGAALVFLAGAIAFRLGGGAFAQGLTALATLVAPVYLGTDSILSMNAFEPLCWMGCAYVLIRIVQTEDSRYWLLFGLFAGLGLENKHSTAFFGIAAAAAILASPLRRELVRPWIWAGGALALLLFLPNALWQWRHGFPTLEDLRNVARSGKNVLLGPVDFVTQQIVLMHPLLFPLWLGGLVSLCAGRLKRYRVLGFTYVALFALFFAMKAKNYYLVPIYPMLLAAGAVAWEARLEAWRAKPERLWPKAVTAGLIAAGGLITAPLVLPLLPPERYLAYQKALGVTPPKTEVGHRGALPQIFGDQFGWPELVAEVAAIYHSLTPDEQSRTTIFANNYGEAGAINLFGPRYGLPRAISGHQTYFLWGPGNAPSDLVIVLQDRRERLEELCASVEKRGEHFHPWGMGEENQSIYLCRGLKMDFPTLWPQVKKWN